MPLPRGYFPHVGPLVVCLLLALTACNGASVGCGREPVAEQVPRTATNAPVERTDDERPKIVVLGDSLTAGLGLLDTQSFPSLLQRKIDTDGFEFEVVNGGVSGDTSAGGLRRLEWVLQEDVRVLIVALGANDGLRGLSAAEMKRNLEQIIETARARQVLVILAGMEAPPNYGAQYATSFRQVYRDLALQYRVPFIPFLLDKVAGQPALNQTDGIHPNQAGAAVVADTVWSVLKPMLDQLSAS